MVQFRRNYVPGGTYFVTVTLRDRRSRVLTDRIDLLRDSVREAREARPFEIVAVVVLPEHLHAVLTLPLDDADYSRRLQAIKARFSRSLAKSGFPMRKDPRGEYLLWTRRFWEHTIRDERDLEKHVNYIHYNPVKHGLVERVLDWPYSAFHRYLRSGWVDPSWAADPSEYTDRAFGERDDA